METKINMVARDGCVGGAMIELRDETRTGFVASSLPQFAAYLQAYKSQIGEGFVAAHSKGCIYTAEKLSYQNAHINPVSCELEGSRPLRHVLDRLNKRLNQTEAEMWLREMRTFLSADGLALLSNIRGMMIQKVVTFARQRDTKGNFAYQYTCEDKSKDGFTPPDTITVTVPQFKHHDDSIALTMEVDFEFVQEKDKDGHPQASGAFWFRVPMLDDILEARALQVVSGHLGGLNVPMFWGRQVVMAATDMWKYMENPIIVKAQE